MCLYHSWYILTAFGRKQVWDKTDREGNYGFLHVLKHAWHASLLGGVILLFLAGNNWLGLFFFSCLTLTPVMFYIAGIRTKKLMIPNN